VSRAGIIAAAGLHATDHPRLRGMVGALLGSLAQPKAALNYAALAVEPALTSAWARQAARLLRALTAAVDAVTAAAAADSEPARLLLMGAARLMVRLSLSLSSRSAFPCDERASDRTAFPFVVLPFAPWSSSAQPRPATAAVGAAQARLTDSVHWKCFAALPDTPPLDASAASSDVAAATVDADAAARAAACNLAAVTGPSLMAAAATALTASAGGAGGASAALATLVEVAVRGATLVASTAPQVRCRSRCWCQRASNEGR